MPRATLSLACLLWLALIGAAAAQSSLNANDPGFASLQNFSGGVSYGGSYFQVQNVAGNGVGWRHGFTQLGVLTPYWVNEDLVIAANGRLLVTDTQDIGGNIGGFIRFYNDDMDRIFGGNAYYDLDTTYLNNHFRQGGFGVETLGQWWDFRANGYIPTESGNRFIQAQGLGQDPFFFANRIGFLGIAQYEQSLYGGDFEFGMPVTPQTPWLRAYGGMYFYRGNGKGVDPIGFRGRVEGWVADDLSVGMIVSEDDQFGTNLNVVVNFLFSGWRPTRWFPNFTTRERMLAPVQRNWRIAAQQYNDKVYIPAINPRTNQPYFVTWVDDSNPLPGNGTFENPFSTMPANSPDADLILVREGNTSAVNPLASSIQLTDFQRLLGEGRAHQFDAYAQFGPYSVPLQTFTLPGFTDSGNYPWLTSLTNAVTIADNNEVSAFNIVNALGAGISNTLAGSNNFDLNHLNLTSNFGGGINLTQARGEGLITNVNALNNFLGGIVIDSGVAPLSLTIQDVTSNSTPLGIQTVGISIDADGSPIVAQLTNVATNDNDGPGILLSESAGMLAVLNNVTSTGNLGSGLQANGVGSVLNLSLTDVDTSGNVGRGIFVTGNGTEISFTAVNLTDNSNGLDNVNFTLTNGSTLVGSLRDARFDNSVLGSGIVLSADNSTIGTLANPFVIENVSADGNFFNGLQIAADNGAGQVVQVVDSSFSGNGLDGIQTLLTGGSAVSLTVDPTVIDGNGRDGFHFELQDGSALFAIFVNDTLNDNNRSAVFGEVDLAGAGGSAVYLGLTNTTGLRSGADGMFIAADQGAAIAIDVVDGDFSDSGQLAALSSGVRIDAANSAVSLSLTRTPAQNTVPYPAGTQEFGLQLNLDSTNFFGQVIDGNFTNNLQHGILANINNGSAALLRLVNVPVDGNGVDGMQVRVANGSAALVEAFDSSFSGNGQALGGAGQGLDLGVDGTAAPAALTVNLFDTTVNANELEGILGTATGTAANAGLLAINTTDVTINSNFAAGVVLNNAAGVVQAHFTDTDISFNLDRGVSYDGAGQGAIASNLTFTNTGISGTTQFNGDDGLSFNVTGGNRLTVSGAFVDFSFNQGRGVNGIVNGAGSAVDINQFLFVSANGNGLEGMRLLVDNGGFLNGNINGGSFSNNGQVAASDGVNVLVDNSGVALLCFDGTTVDFNRDDGFDFSVQNGGVLKAALQTSGVYGILSASNNLDQAVVFDVGAGSTGLLFMDGPNVFNGSGSATAAIQFTATNAPAAAFGFSGTSEGNAGDAINVQMTNIADAYIDIHGPGSLSNNGGNAVDIALTNVTFHGAPLVVSFLQGNFASNPFNISDLTMEGNGDEAIRVVGAGVTMTSGTIADNVIDGSGQNGAGDGILLDFSAASLIASLTLDGNVSDNNAGHGINVVGANSTFGTLTIANGGMHVNQGNGLNIDMTNTPITTLNITGNRQGTSQLIGLDFQIIGNTFGQPFSIQNTSVAGFNITDFQLDLSPSGVIWDTEEPGAAIPFAPLAGSDITTGLTTVNGNPWPNALPSGGLPDDQPILDLAFTDFNPGETFTWQADVDFVGAPGSTVLGSDLVGSLITVNFTGGAFLTGTLQPLGLNGSQFVASGGTLTGPGISSNHGDGIRLSLVNSDISNLNIVNNEIDANDGSDGAGPIPGHGIHFAVVNNSALPNVNISQNTILGNTGDGVRLVDPNLPALSKILNLTMNGNTIDGNDGHGANFVISNGETLNLAMVGNTIGTEGNGNGGMGVRAVINNTSAFNATIGNAAGAQNVFAANRDAGVGIIMNDNALGSVTVINSRFNQSVDGADANFDGVGLGIILNDSVALSPLHIGDFTVQNTAFNQNAADGLLLRMNDATQLFGDAQIYNVQANGNGGNGVSIRLTDTAQIPSLLVLGSAAGAEFSGNTGHGFALSTNGLSNVNTVNMQSVTARTNSGDGLNFRRVGSSQIMNVTINNATLAQNSGDGLDVTAANLNATDTYTITNSSITSNVQNGSLFNLIGDADLDVTLVGNTISNNTLSGIQTTTIADITDTPTIVLDIRQNTINGNLVDGINILTPHQANIDLNTISNNGRDGINIAGPSGFFFFIFPIPDTITRNTISGNGDDGIDISAGVIGAVIGGPVSGNTIINNGDDGIALTSNTNGGFQVIQIQENLIRGNAGDGIQIAASNGSGGLLLANDYQIDDNSILDNGRRGINIVNAGGTNGEGGTINRPTVTNLVISGNSIRRSGLEGIYIINTAAEDQASADNINNLASAALLANGSVFAKPRLSVVVDNNTVDSNGQTLNPSDFIGATGLVLRVGTSDALAFSSSGNVAFQNNGGFANGGRGGVVATVTNNTFTGQFGADVAFHPFISTQPPPTTAGEWTDNNNDPRDPTNDEFRIDSYVQDPLARLDLVFTGNSGEGFVATIPSLAAATFYNNNEEVFKSRTVAQDGTDPPDLFGNDDNGPFASGTRARNATRLANRGALPPGLTIIGTTGQNSDTFLYPGMGLSTFRRSAASTSAGFGTVAVDFTDAIPIGGAFGELPFVWGSF